MEHLLTHSMRPYLPIHIKTQRRKLEIKTPHEYTTNFLYDILATYENKYTPDVFKRFIPGK